jgi:putative inorganic carbon (HCO3(-)) transporter
LLLNRFFSQKANTYALVIGIVFVITNTICIFKEFYWLNLIPLALVVVYLAIFKLNILIFTIVALTPLSVPLREIITGAPIDFYIPTEPIIAGIMLLYFIKLLYQKNIDISILHHPITIAILINLAWMLITCITSTMPLVSFKYLTARIWFLVIFYFLASQLFVRFKNIQVYIWCYSLTFIIVIVYFTVRLSGFGFDKLAANWITRPFYADHTSYAAAIAMLIPVMFGILFIRRKASNSRRFFYIGMIIFYILSLILSYTRAAWVSLAFAMPVLIAMKLRINIKAQLLILLGTLAIISIYWVDVEIMMQRNTQNSSDNLFKHLQSIYNIKSDDSNLERLNRWNSAIQMYKEKPVFGFGPGTYMFKYAPYQASYLKTSISTNTGTLGNSHSEYLGPLAESGLFGSISFIIIVFTTLFTASRLYFKAHKRKVRIMALSIMIGLVTYCVHGFMNNFLDTDKLSALFWGFTAMIVALDVYHNKEKNPISMNKTLPPAL